MMAYASRTGTKRNLEALRAAGWRLMVSARGVLRTEGFPYALDNGAWTAHRAGEAFDEGAFDRAVVMLGRGADFIVAPDIVEGGSASLALSVSWLDRLAPIAPVLIAVQDGMTAGDVAPMLDARVGLFVGGSTAWKLATLEAWCDVASWRRCHIHVGRVNTARRIAMCASAGAHSFDGSSVSRFANNLPKLERARRQEPIRWR